MFLCGLSHTDPLAAQTDVCCTVNLDIVTYYRHNGTLNRHAWEVFQDRDRCNKVYPTAISEMPLLGFVVSILQLFKAMLFLLTDFHHAPRRPALILSFLGRVICSALLFVLCFRDIDDPHIVPKGLQPYAAHLELQNLFKLFSTHFHHTIKVPVKKFHLYVSYGYAGLYLLEEIYPPFHAIRVPWFSLHAGSKWLNFADGLLRTSVWSDRGRIGETLRGWALWVITLLMKAVFSYFQEIRIAVQHPVLFWEASHCLRTSDDGSASLVQ